MSYLIPSLKLPVLKPQIGLRLAVFLILSGFLADGVINATKMFPDLSCHPGYNATRMDEEYKLCLKGENESEKVDDYDYVVDPNDLPEKCYQLCMLSSLNMLMVDININYDDDTGTPYVEDKGTHEPIYLLTNRKSGNEEFCIDEMFGNELSNKLKTDVVNKCKNILHQVAYVQKLPCEKWEPLYNCVNDAVKC